MKKIAAFLLFFIFFYLAVVGLSAQTNTPAPTPTPDPEEVATPPAIGTKAYCQRTTISSAVLNPGGGLTITSTANNTNIKTFSYRFYNVDNAGKEIKFKSGTSTTSTKVYTRTIV